MEQNEAHDMIEGYCGRTFTLADMPREIAAALLLAQRDGWMTPQIQSLCNPYRVPLILP